MEHRNFINDGQASGESSLVSRNITIWGKRTSVRLEPEMWLAMKDIAAREQCTSHDLCSLISLRKRPNTSLTAAIRVFIMLYFKAASTDIGHERAGHGSFENMKARARIKMNDAPVLYRARPSVMGSVQDNTRVASA